MAHKADKRKITINLTTEQRVQVQQATGKEVGALEFTAEELEERIAPGDIAMSSIRNMRP